MKLYTAKTDTTAAKKFVADDMILTKELPTTAGSRMLEGYVSLFEAEAVARLINAGYGMAGKADVGEFSIDLVGETSFNGAVVQDEKLLNAAAEIVKSGDVMAALCLDVNGSVRRAAAQSNLVAIKPTYGTVSRYGTIPVVCSGETVSVIAKSADDCGEIISVILGHDDKDGTSHGEDVCAKIRRGTEFTPIKRVALLKNMTEGADEGTKRNVDAFCETLKANGVEVEEIDDAVIAASRAAWNILLCAELCNNVSRYDGVKYGYRTENYTNIDELYTNSRTEAFGPLLKTAILFGSETLSTENYQKQYDKALRVRRVVKEAFEKRFESFDALVLPACSKMAYSPSDVKENQYMAFEENFFTAPASITGLPCVIAGGVQMIGKALSENALLSLAKLCEKGGK